MFFSKEKTQNRETHKNKLCDFKPWREKRNIKYTRVSVYRLKAKRSTLYSLKK